jgi:hypothetical protein
MKRVVAILFACCCLGSSSALAIECQSAAGNPKTGWYAWREIEGRKCWFKKTGAMPAKSELHWPAKVQEQARSREPNSPPQERSVAVAVSPKEPASSLAERTVAVAVPPPQADPTEEPESNAAPPPQFFKTIRVRPAMEAPVRLGNGQVDLMNSASVSAVPAIGPARQNPPSRVAADPFEARFNGHFK